MSQRLFGIRSARMFVWLLVMALVLSACPPQPDVAEPPPAPVPEAPPQFVLNLPPLALNVDFEGQVSPGNIPAQIAQFAGVDFSAISFPADQVEWLVDNDIQHVQLNVHPTGLNVVVNGRRIPSLAWDQQSRAEMMDMLDFFGIVIPAADTLLFVVDRLGVSLILNFPIAEGVAPLPLTVPVDPALVERARLAQEEFLESVRTPPRLHFTLVYAANGSWAMAGIPSGLWLTSLGLPPDTLHLDAESIAALTEANVQEIQIRTQPDALYISIDGRQLPRLIWGQGELHHVLDLAEQAGLWEDLLEPDADVAVVGAAVRDQLAVVQTFDFNITLVLPN